MLDIFLLVNIQLYVSGLPYCKIILYLFCITPSCVLFQQSWEKLTWWNMDKYVKTKFTITLGTTLVTLASSTFIYSFSNCTFPTFWYTSPSRSSLVTSQICMEENGSAVSGRLCTVKHGSTRGWLGVGSHVTSVCWLLLMVLLLNVSCCLIKINVMWNSTFDYYKFNV